LKDTWSVDLFEAGPRLGGKLQSHRIAGAVVEESANGLLDGDPAVGRLIEGLGLRDSVLTAQPGTRFIYRDNALHPVPLSPPALFKGSTLTGSARMRLLTEPFRVRGPTDESVADFVRRRLGPQVLERLVEPFVTGIHAGDVERLSVAACFPALKEAELTHGSLLRGLRQRSKESPNASPGKLVSFRGGLGTLVRALETALGDRVHTGTTCTALRRVEGGWQLEGVRQEAIYDSVVLACPARASARLLRGLAPEATKILEAMEHVSLAVVAGLIPTETWTPPAGFGCLVVPGPGSPGVLGLLQTTNIFPDHAAEGHATVRLMLGGARDPEVLAAGDDDLLARARFAAETLIGPFPPFAAHRVFRHAKAIPQYHLGHLERVAALRETEESLPGLFLTGHHLDGIAVKDCIRAGEATASRVASAG
jgi:oxygen-dependent protoporphyrinogen oxidase